VHEDDCSIQAGRSPPSAVEGKPGPGPKRALLARDGRIRRHTTRTSAAGTKSNPARVISSRIFVSGWTNVRKPLLRRRSAFSSRMPALTYQRSLG
jgi:hypothetical protein